MLPADHRTGLPALILGTNASIYEHPIPSQFPLPKILINLRRRHVVAFPERLIKNVYHPRWFLQVWKFIRWQSGESLPWTSLIWQGSKFGTFPAYTMEQEHGEDNLRHILCDVRVLIIIIEKRMLFFSSRPRSSFYSQ